MGTTKESERERRKRATKGAERNKERVLLVILTISFVFFFCDGNVSSVERKGVIFGVFF